MSSRSRVSSRPDARVVVISPRTPDQKFLQKILDGWLYEANQNERQNMRSRRSSRTITATMNVQNFIGLRLVCNCLMTFEMEELSELWEEKRFELHCLVCNYCCWDITRGIHSWQRASALDCNVLQRNCLRPPRNPHNVEMYDMKALCWPRKPTSFFSMPSDLALLTYDALSGSQQWWNLDWRNLHVWHCTPIVVRSTFNN